MSASPSDSLSWDRHQGSSKGARLLPVRLPRALGRFRVKFTLELIEASDRYRGSSCS
jgi:hypothetical protein